MKDARGWLLASSLIACSPARAPDRIPEVVAPAAPTRTPEVIVTEQARFSIGPSVALEGGEGAAIAARGSRIATFDANGATYWVDGVRRTVPLPWIVQVSGARWSADGSALFVGTGRIDVARGDFEAHPAFAKLVLPGPPGGGSLALHATSWSADGRHAAALLAWEGARPPRGAGDPARVVVLDLAGGASPVTLPAEGASAVRIAGDRIVVGAPVVRVWTLDGVEVAALPAGAMAPNAISAGDDGPVLVIDPDAIRVVDPVTWTVKARWVGHFIDAVAVPGGLVALEMSGRLHAGCIDAGRVREAGTAEAGLGTMFLAATGDGRLAMTGAHGARVVPFELQCGS